MKTRNYFLAALLILSTFVFSQTAYIQPIIGSDSLKGFDEAAALKSAISENFTGDELKVRLYRLKREFINNKYGLVHTPLNEIRILHSNTYKANASSSCVNEDFEASSIGAITPSNPVNGWNLDEGYNGIINSSSAATLIAYYPNGLSNPSSCNALGCCPMPPSQSEIIDCSAPGGYIDPAIGYQYPIFSVFGTGTVSGASSVNPQITQGLFGNKVLRINNGVTGDYSISRLSKTINVTSQNSFFQYAFIPVFSPGHACCDAPTLQINVKDNLGFQLACPNHTFSAPNSLCTSTTPYTYYNAGSGTTYSPNINYNNIYSPWILNSIDLTPYIGQYVTLEVTVFDCTAGGHMAFAFFDAQCAALELTINDSIYSLTNSVIHYNSCQSQFTMSVPANVGPVTWNGPLGFSSTSAVISGSLNGTYTLTIGQGVLCSAITKTIQISAAQNSVSASSSDSLICNGATAILKVLGVNTCTWNTGQTNPIIFVSPSITTNYSVSGTDNNGCTFNTSITQLVNDCTGFSELQENNAFVIIFPNPNNGSFELNINKLIGSGELALYAVNGKEVHKQKVLQGKNSIKTNGLAAGIYYYSVIDNTKVISKGKIRIEE